MNGRIYDPLLGRMLSADILVHSASNLQCYNRYSYIANNPLSGVDPSGFDWLSDSMQQMKAKEAAADAQRQAINKDVENSDLGASAHDRICGDTQGGGSTTAGSTATSGAQRAQATDTPHSDNKLPSNDVKPADGSGVTQDTDMGAGGSNGESKKAPYFQQWKGSCGVACARTASEFISGKKASDEDTLSAAMATAGGFSLSRLNSDEGDTNGKVGIPFKRTVAVFNAVLPTGSSLVQLHDATESQIRAALATERMFLFGLPSTALHPELGHDVLVLRKGSAYEMIDPAYNDHGRAKVIPFTMDRLINELQFAPSPGITNNFFYFKY
jgi:hypothetical protein